MVQCEILEQQLLGAQPVDEEPIPQLPINGQPSLFDFIGLRQPGQGQGHFHLLNNVEHNHGGEQIDDEEQVQSDNLDDAQEVMQGEDADMLKAFPVLQHVLHIDLNNLSPMEVQGDEAEDQNQDNANLLDLNIQEDALDLNLELLQFEAIQGGLIDLNVLLEEVIGPEPPNSMLINSYAQADSDSRKSVQLEISSSSEISVVLALQAAPVGLLHSEIQLHELNVFENQVMQNNNEVEQEKETIQIQLGNQAASLQELNENDNQELQGNLVLEPEEASMQVQHEDQVVNMQEKGQSSL
jgi:hypothetical protein